MSKVSIFVFGSNEAGRHGKGAALHARNYKGAIYGQKWGLQGQSFAIPTKDLNLKPLSLLAIEIYAKAFVKFAVEHPEMNFQLTPIGCGLAGFKPEQIAPFFKNAPPNVFMPTEFLEVLCPSSSETI